MAKIRWEDLDPQTYEDMVAVLVRSVWPDVIRIDGSGGDGGTDGRRSVASVLIHAFEYKSFTGRMTKPRRTKVEKSLARAAKLQPKEKWSLVVPIDPNPAELEWFDGLREKYPFELEWLGKTWLIDELSKRDRIRRYFLDDYAREVLDCIRELREEEAALANGVPDAMARAERLAARLNELDPYYAFDITIRSDGEREISMKPRFPDATDLRPITGTMLFEFPDTPEGKAKLDEVVDAMKFGTGYELDEEYVANFTIDAPAGFGGEFANARVVVTPHDEAPEPVCFVHCILDDSGFSLAELPIFMDRRTVGHGGMTSSGRDRTGAITVKNRFDAESKWMTINIQFSTPRDCHPHELAAPFRFLRALRTGSKIDVQHRAEPEFSYGVPLTEELQRGIVEDGYLDMIDLLARVQVASGVYFPIPEELSREDLRELDDARRLLEGGCLKGRIKGPSSVTVFGEGLRIMQDHARSQSDFRIMTAGGDDGALTVTVAGHVMKLGNWATVMPTLKVLNADEVLAAEVGDDPDSAIEVMLGPGSTDAAETFLAEFAPKF